MKQPYSIVNIMYMCTWISLAWHYQADIEGEYNIHGAAELLCVNSQRAHDALNKATKPNITYTKRFCWEIDNIFAWFTTYFVCNVNSSRTYCHGIKLQLWIFYEKWSSHLQLWNLCTCRFHLFGIIRLIIQKQIAVELLSLNS